MFFQLLAAMESQFKVLLESNVEEQDVPDLSLMMYSDIMALNPMIMELLVDALRSHRVTPSLLESFESVYKETWVPMTRLLDGLSTRLVSHFVRKCSEPLKQVRNIPSQYRRTNRDVSPSNIESFQK